MVVLPGNGTDLIQFGVTEEEACKILGKPDKTYITDEDNRRLQFNKARIELSFEPDNDDRLGWIEVHHPESMLFGKKVIGMQQDEVLELVTGSLNEQPIFDDYDSFISVSYDNNWVELQFEFGCLRNINLGVLYDESETPIWPNT